MNGLPDRKTQDETWATYIRRRIGKERFTYTRGYAHEGEESGPLKISGRLDTDDIRIFVDEIGSLPETANTFKGNLKFDNIYTSISLQTQDWSDSRGIDVFEDDRVKLFDEDASETPSYITEPFESYSSHGDVHRLVYDIIGLVKKSLDSNSQPPPSSRQ